MSIQAQAWALAQQVVTEPTSRHVLLVLAGYAGQDGRGAYPTASRLALDTGLHERTVRAKLLALEAEGVIRRDREMAGFLESRGTLKAICYDLMLDAKAPTPAPVFTLAATAAVGEEKAA